MRFFSLALGALLLVFSMTACYDSIDTNFDPVPKTGEVDELGAISVIVSGTADLGDDPKAYNSPQFVVGVEYSLQNTFEEGKSMRIQATEFDNKSFNVKLAALMPNTTYYYRTFITKSSGSTDEYFGQTASFRTSQMTAQDSCVDLGLPTKTLWATMNVGANTPIEYGTLFAWGETSQKQGAYDWTTYRWSDGYNDVLKLPILTKYCTNSNYGNVDGKYILDQEDDAAAVNWGAGWKMPSKKQFSELINNCRWVWTSMYNGNGWIVTSKINGNAIFLPAAGEIGKDPTILSRNEASYSGFYWSQEIDQNGDTGYSGSAYILTFDKRDVLVSEEFRCYALSVRAVRSEPMPQAQR